MARVSKYLNQSQTIEGVEYKTISYLKGKVEVVAEGYEGSTWMVTKTWVNAKIKTFKKRLESFFHKIAGKITEVALMIIGHTGKQEVQDVDNSLVDFKNIYSLRELKKAYRRLSKIFHPDMKTGNAETFKELKTIYTIKKGVMEEITEEDCELFGMVEGDDMWMELVKDAEDYRFSHLSEWI